MHLFQTLSRVFRGSFFCLLLIVLFTPAHAQFKFREPPNRQDPASLGELKGDALWNWFLENRAIGTFTLEGELVHRPAGAPSESMSVSLRGNWTGDTEQTQLRLSRNGTTVVERTAIASDRKTLVQGSNGNADPVPVDWDDPLVEEFPFTWFDLLMPFLDWSPAEYLGPDRYLGRPAHRYQLTNPRSDAFPHKVVATLDEDFAALLKVDMYDERSEIIKRMRVGGFKKFGDVWMVSELNWLDRQARSSVRLEVYSFTITQ